MHIDLQELTIDEELGITIEDVKKDLTKAIKRVYIDGKPAADVLSEDYAQYRSVTGKDPDETIKKIMEHDLENVRPLYPGMDDLDIVGFLFSEKFYKAVKKRHKLNSK